MRHRAVLMLAMAVAMMEAAGFVADWRWSFRTRLLSAFDAATRAGNDEDTLWQDPGKPFEPGYREFTQALRFRRAGSTHPTGEAVDPKDLPAGRRVVVLGESAAFGVGCRSEETFAAVLDRLLQPKNTRVLNAGQVGADPWQVMEAGVQILNRYEPWALVLFTGNNLWITWTPPQQKRWDPQVIAVLNALATSRAIAGLEFLLIRETLLHARLPGAGFQDHRELAGSRYALEHPLPATKQFGPADWLPVQRLYLQRFETSLEELTRHALARSVRVVLVTLPFNYRLSPAWKHPQFEAFDAAHVEPVRDLLHQAGRRVQSGDCAAALPLIDQGLALDPLPPVLHYLRAQCLEQLGRLEEAEEEYAQSREQMIGNLGSRLSVNQVIRRVAARFNVPLVDAARIFDDYEHAHGRHFNEDLILDDCHPSPLGHQLIANALAPLL